MGFSYSSKLGDGTGVGDNGFSYNPATDTLTVDTLAAKNVTATGLATPGAITVTPVLTQTGTVNVVAGASLADGDYFTVDYGAGTIPIEFDATPGNGTTGGRIPYIFAPGDSAGAIRDGLIALINAAAPTQVTASIGGAAAITITRIPAGTAGGVITENVANAGFTVAGFADPTAATTVTYKLVATLSDGTTTEAGVASSTAASTATLSAANFIRLAWSAVTGSTGYKVYRTVAPTSPATVGVVYTGTALTFDDVGVAGDTTTPPTVDGTGVVRGDRVLVGDGSAAAPSYSFVSSPTSGPLWNVGSTAIDTYVSGTFASRLSSTVFTTPNTLAISANADVLLTRGAAAATLQLGAANAASPVSQTLQSQGSRGGTDTDVAGANLTIRPGAGTGAAAGSALIFQTPTATGSSSTAQTQTTRLTLSQNGTQPAGQLIPGNGTAALPSYTFGGDNTTGMFRATTGPALAFSYATAEKLRITGAGVDANIGTGTATARVGGVLHVSTTAQATTGTAEEVLATYTLPANTLSADGKAIRITYHASTASNANSKTLRVRLTNTAGALLSQQVTTASGVESGYTLTIVRTGAATFNSYGSGTIGTVSGINRTGATAATWSGNVVFVITGLTPTALGDLTFQYMLVEAVN